MKLKEELENNEVNSQEVSFKELIMGNGVYKLPCAHTCLDGSSLEEVTIREIRGSEEEILLKKDIISNPALIVTSMLEGVVTNRLGKTEIQKMTTGNRDFCFIAACHATFADEKGKIHINTPCPKCEETIKMYVVIPEMKVMLTGVKNEAIVTGTFPRCGKRFSSKLTTGEVQEDISRNSKGSIGVASTIAMGKCIVSIEGEKMLSKQFYQNLSIKDRMYYMTFLSKFMSGVDTAFNIHCNSCNRDVDVRLSPIDFFTLEEME